MIPNSSDPLWSKILTGEISFEPKFLGLKLLLLRSKMVLDRNNSDTQLQLLVDEVRSFFLKNEKYLGPDIQGLFG